MSDTAKVDELLDQDLIKAVDVLSEIFAAKSIKYTMIGGLATVLRGRPRFTQDADFLLQIQQLALPGLLEALEERGFQFDMATVIRQYVYEHMTVLRFGPVRIDWLKPILPFYQHVLSNASELDWSTGHTIRVATAEGLIMTKMVAFRPQDQADIDTLLAANRDQIDIAQIREEWAPFAAKEPLRTAWLEEAITRRVIDRQ